MKNEGVGKYQRLWDGFLDYGPDLFSILSLGAIYLYYQSTNANTEVLLVGILLALASFAISSLFSRVRKLNLIQKKLVENTELFDKKILNRINAAEFFNPKAKIEDSQISEASEIWICGVTLGTTSLKYADEFKKSMQGNARVKFVVVDSENNCAVTQVVERSWGQTSNQYYKEKLAATKTVLDIVASSSRGKGELLLGHLKFLPPFGITMINPDTVNGIGLVELYHLTSEDNPKFLITAKSDPYWFEFFKHQFELIWDRARQESLSSKEILAIEKMDKGLIDVALEGQGV